MYTVRVEDMGDYVGYVVMKDGEDRGAFKTREEADIAIRLTALGAEKLVQFGIESAADYALRMHGDQEHGSLKMADHLTVVSTLVAKFCDYPEDSVERLHVVSAAWLHDILEDTDLTYEELVEEVSEDVADLVEAVTDRPGANRYQRHLDTYWRIREKGGDAVLIKLADRMHNHARSLEFNECYLKMYHDEYRYFKMALWRPGEHVTMWSVLDEQYQRMKDHLDGTRLQERECVGRHAGTGEAPDGPEQGAGSGYEGREGL